MRARHDPSGFVIRFCDQPDGLHFTISETGWGKAPKKDELSKVISGKIQHNKL